MSKWIETTWGEVATLEYGKALRGYQDARGPVRVFGTNGPVGWTDSAQAEGPGVIVGRKGAYRGVHYSKEDFWVIDTAYYLKPRERLDMRWAYYALSCLDINSMDSGSAIPSTSRKDFYALPVLIPPEAEQYAIAATLGALDDKIAVNERIERTYEELLASRFDLLGVDVEAEDHQCVTVSDFVDFNPRVSASQGDHIPYVDMAALPTASARVQSWSRRSPKSGSKFANGDTVLARITPCLENGKTAYIDFMADGEVGSGSTEFIVMRAREGIPAQLPYFLARSERFRRIAIRNMVGSSGRQRVGAAQLADIPVMRPDEAALREFGEAASNAFAHMKSLGHENQNLAQLRDTLLPKLMSGEIRVRDAEKAVEEAT